MKTVTGDFNLVGERPASPSKTGLMINTDQAQDAVTTDAQSQQEFAVGDRVRCRYIGRDWKYGVVTELEPLRVLADRFDRDWVWDEVEKVSSGTTFSPSLLRLDSDECEISKHHTVDYQWCGRLDSEECEIGKCNANDYSDYHTSDSDWTNEYQTQDPDDQGGHVGMAEFRVGVTVADADGCIGVVEKVDMTDPAGKFYKVQWSRHGAHHGAAGYYDSSSLRKLQVQDTLEVVKNIHDQRPQIRRGATCEILDVSRSNGDIRVHVDGKDFPCWIKNKNMTRVRLVNRAR